MSSIRERLTSAAAKLREAEQFDEAQAVEAVLAPRGYLLLQRSERREASSPLTITTNADLKQVLEEAAQEFGAVFSGLAEEAYRKVRDEGWIPPRPLMNRGGARAVLNVKVDAHLRDEVREMLPGLSQEAGFKVAEGNIVLAYICEELGVERPGVPFGEPLQMRFPRVLVQHWTETAEARGLSLQQIVEDGIHEFLDGSFTPERHPYFTVEKRGPRTGTWSESERQRFWLPLDVDLVGRLRAKTQESGEYGYRVYPGSIVRAILTDRLGEPAE